MNADNTKYSKQAVKKMYEQLQKSLPIKIKDEFKNDLRIVKVELRKDGIYGVVDKGFVCKLHHIEAEE